MNDVRLHGVISTVVTPFNDDDSINFDLLRKEIQYLLAAGVDGICACGTTGEGYALSAEESAEVCRAVVEEVDGRLPVVGGIIQNSTAEVIRYGKALKQAGVDALQITPIHYLISPDKDGTVEYYRKIGEELDMPIVIYNVVGWAMIPLDVIERLADLKHVVGIKQSGGNIHLLADLMVRVKDKLTILAAIDDLHYPSFVMGVHGTLAAIPTVTPKLTVQLWDAVQQGDHDTALQIHETILPIWRAVEGPTMPAKIKEALRLQGRPAGKARHPIQSVSEQESADIYEALKQGGLLAVEFQNN